MLRLTVDCVLESSSDGGVTWLAVPGWTPGFGQCVRDNIPPPVPTLPDPGHPDQGACNLAGYLAADIIHAVVSQAVIKAAASTSQIDFVNAMLQLLSGRYPVLTAIGRALSTLYGEYVVANLADFTSADGDGALWSAVTCCIFDSIRTVGYVDGTNFAAIEACIRAIGYIHPVVITALGDFWHQLGLGNVQAAQVVGAFDVVDCTGCNLTWCYSWDFTTSNGSFAKLPSHGGVYVPGSGWHTEAEGGEHSLLIYLDTPSTLQVTGMEVWVQDPDIRSTGPGVRAVYCESPVGTSTFFIAIPNIAYPAVTRLNYDGHGPDAANRILVSWDGDGTGGLGIISRLQVQGNGINPFGLQNCI
jgi:hypothetical protein